MIENAAQVCYNKSVEGRGHFYLPSNSRYLRSVRAPRQGNWQNVDGGFLYGVTMKQCSACQQWKDESEFHKNHGMPDGLNSKCKPCKSAYDRWLANNPSVVEVDFLEE